MIFCLLNQRNLRDDMIDDSDHSHSKSVCYSFLEPLPEIIFVDTATDLAGSRDPPTEKLTLRGVTYKLCGGTSFVGGGHYHAIINYHDGWYDIDSIDDPCPNFDGPIQVLPPKLPVFGWMLYEKQH